VAGPSVPLLATKLHAPRRRGVVPRPRLREQLDRRGQPALTLVSAAAGFGKTTLVADWFADGPATAWLSLDPGDNDPALFWTYVVAALHATCPEAAAGARALLDGPPPTTDAVVTTLLNDLHALDHDIVLVLDDYHVIESPEVHDGVAFLLGRLPAHAHLVIASRSDPPLALAALRARGELLEIRAADLRFTSDEAADYLNDAMDLTLAPGDVEVLEARTEGWIAALQLAALSMQGRPDVAGFIADFAGDDRFILDYLVGEVLDRQSAEVRSFLLETSVLGRLTGPLCDAVTGRTDSRARLEQLERANLFLVPLDDRRTWYRYHHLFADVLRARLLDEGRDRIPELHRRAADWYDADGDAVEAITHALAGGDVERAAQLIELAAPALTRNRKEASVRRWLEALPDEVFPARPVLALSLAGVRMATGDPTGVAPLLDLVESALEPGAPPPIVVDVDAFDRLPAQLEVQRAGLALLGGDLAGATAHATRVLDLIEPDDHLQRGAATALLGLAHWAKGELVAAERRYGEAVASLVAAGHLADALGCSLALADMQVAQGRLGDAVQTFESGLRWTTEHPGLRGAADMHVGMSEVLIERNDLDGAARHLEASTLLGDAAGLPQNPYRRRVARALLGLAHGDLDGALELLDEALPLYDTDFSPPVRPVAAIRARVRRARGDVSGARRWAAEHHLAADDDLTYVDEYAHLTLARTLLAPPAAGHDGPSPDEAIRLLERLLAAAEDGGRRGSRIEALALLASAHHARGDAEAAGSRLEDAVRRAEPEGHVRAVLDAGPAMPDLLRALAATAGAPPHAHRILAATAASVPVVPGVPAVPAASAPRSPSGLVDDLSARELDVLRLLRSDLSGPEIARELLVSLNTLRTHTKHIYTKLGVNNRREATTRAAELGL
jgi:LuxR family maltose regulon positive regulatory protein